VFWHPRGARVRHVIETFWKDLHLARGYELVYSPHIAKVRACSGGGILCCGASSVGCLETFQRGQQ
jgi:threonyl-tRNA synthetase